MELSICDVIVSQKLYNEVMKDESNISLGGKTILHALFEQEDFWVQIHFESIILKGPKPALLCCKAWHTKNGKSEGKKQRFVLSTYFLFTVSKLFEG